MNERFNLQPGDRIERFLSPNGPPLRRGTVREVRADSIAIEWDSAIESDAQASGVVVYSWVMFTIGALRPISIIDWLSDLACST